jgi:hypothetical protein
VAAKPFCVACYFRYPVARNIECAFYLEAAHFVWVVFERIEQSHHAGFHVDQFGFGYGSHPWTSVLARSSAMARIFDAALRRW